MEQIIQSNQLITSYFLLAIIVSLERPKIKIELDTSDYLMEIIGAIFVILMIGWSLYFFKNAEKGRKAVDGRKKPKVNYIE